MAFQSQSARSSVCRRRKPKPLSPSTRFNTTVSSEEIEKSSKGCVPAGTAKSTNWTVRTFQQWLIQRKKRMPQESFPDDILQKEYPTVTLCRCLQCFVSEARRHNTPSSNALWTTQVFKGVPVRPPKLSGKMLDLRSSMVPVIQLCGQNMLFAWREGAKSIEEITI